MNRVGKIRVNVNDCDQLHPVAIDTIMWIIRGTGSLEAIH